jgi:tetratricopeptide (TPR) repeat protein
VGLSIAERLAASDTANAGAQRDLSVVYAKVADALAAESKLSEAAADYVASLAIREKLAASDPDNAAWQRDLEVAIEKIGDVSYRFLMARDFAKALELADLAIKRAPGLGWLYTNRAHALMFLGRTEEARALYLGRKGEKTQGDKPWEVVIREDFVELRKAGLSDPLMDEVDAAFAAAH